MLYIFYDELLRVMAKGHEYEGWGESHWGPVTPLFGKEKNLAFFQTKVPFFRL